MPRGMFCSQNDIELPCTRTSSPLIDLRCAAADRPYGPAPMMTTSALDTAAPCGLRASAQPAELREIAIQVVAAAFGHLVGDRAVHEQTGERRQQLSRLHFRAAR